MEKMDEKAVVLKQFGDEKSTLLDLYERHCFEIQLNQVILGRSLSEPGVFRNRASLMPPLHPPSPLVKHARQCKRYPSTTTVTGFRKAIKKLLKPFGRKKQGQNDDIKTPKDHKFHKILRSMSVKI